MQLQQPLAAIPASLSAYALTLGSGGNALVYTYDTSEGEDDQAGIAALLRDLAAADVHFRDLSTSQSSLEDIFVGLVTERKAP
jgi:ABC-2 type transport system ATP-binding protein